MKLPILMMCLSLVIYMRLENTIGRESSEEKLTEDQPNLEIELHEDGQICMNLHLLDCNALCIYKK